MIRTKSISSNARTEAAEALAAQALGFIASDPARLGVYLDESGLTPQTLRAAASEPGFLAGVLEHLCRDESALVAFAANAGLDPARVDAARRLLSDPQVGSPDP